MFSIHMFSILCVTAMMVSGTKERERALEHSTMQSKKRALYCKILCTCLMVLLIFSVVPST